MPGQSYQPPIQPQPNNIAARITITVFSDGQPPAFESSVDYLTSLKVLGSVIIGISNIMQQGVKKPLPPMEDKKRQYAGPREEKGE